MGSSVPLIDNNTSSPYTIDKDSGRTSMTPGFFRTLNIPLLSGWAFNEHDTSSSPLVTVISQSTAKRFFPNDDPVGKTIIMGSADVPLEVVGVAGDVRSLRLDISLTM